MEQILQQLVDILPGLSEATMRSMILCVTDREKFLAYTPAATLDVGIRKGDPLSASGSTYQAIQDGRKIIAEIPADVHGVPYIAATIPIFANDRVIGSLATAYPLQRERELKEMSSSASGAVRAANSAVESLLAAAKILSANALTLNELASSTANTAHRADQVADFIKQVADSTQLLGLNAAIESAHAGEFGKGFGVVAAEIRKMAASNKDAAQSITKFVQGLQDSITEVANRSQDLGALSEELTASLEEIATTTHHLTLLSERLNKLSELDAVSLTEEVFAR